MSRRKKHPEHVNHERWLVSYADFITLLFAFFVVMYAISQADMNKLKKVAESMRSAFAGGASGMIQSGGMSGGETVAPFQHTEAPGGRLVGLPAGKTNVAADDSGELESVRDKLEESISLEMGMPEGDAVPMLEYDSRGLVIRIVAKNLFAARSPEVAEDLKPLLDRVARILKTTDRVIRIEGHTAPGEVPDAWLLGSARAGSVARDWIKRFEFDPKRLIVASRGDSHPLKKPEQSRRIEVIVLNSAYGKAER